MVQKEGRSLLCKRADPIISHADRFDNCGINSEHESWIVSNNHVVNNYQITKSLAALLVQWLEYAVANGVARVRFPDSAFQENFEKLILQIHLKSDRKSD